MVDSRDICTLKTTGGWSLDICTLETVLVNGDWWSVSRCMSTWNSTGEWRLVDCLSMHVHLKLDRWLVSWRLYIWNSTCELLTQFVMISGLKQKLWSFILVRYYTSRAPSQWTQLLISINNMNSKCYRHQRIRAWYNCSSWLWWQFFNPNEFIVTVGYRIYYVRIGT